MQIFRAVIFALITLPVIGKASTHIEVKGPFRDPAHYGAGWTSAHYNSIDGCIVFLQGHVSSGNPNNSVRCFYPETGKFVFLQKDTENAANEINGDGINTRDNQLSLGIPGYGIFITGGAYLMGKPYTWGFFDYKKRKWTHRGPSSNIGQGFISWGNYQTFNAAAVWSKKYNRGFIYNGESAGNTKRQIVEVFPNKDGTFNTKQITDAKNTPNCLRARNSAVAIGDWIYVYGGICLVSGKRVDTNWFYRFNLITHRWQRLGGAPYVRRMPQVTYDPVTKDIVVYGGGKNKFTPSNIVMTWNVSSQGPWVDRTEEAEMPAVMMPNGAYDPKSGFHCYRGGRYLDGSVDRVWCMRFAQRLGGAIRTGQAIASSRPKVTGSVLNQRGTASAPSFAQKFTPTPAKNRGLSLPPSGTTSVLSASHEDATHPAKQREISLPPPGVISISPNGQQITPTRLSDHTGGRPPRDDPTAGRAPRVVGTIHPRVITRDIPQPPSLRVSPVGVAKHMRFTEATTADRKLYLVSGDWIFADHWPSSGRQDTFSYDLFADKWERVVPYCTPNGQQPRHTDEVVQAWDTKRNRLWVGPGTYYGPANACPGLKPMMAFNPTSRTWSRPAQKDGPEFLHLIRPPSWGVYDAKTDSILTMHDIHVAQFFPSSGIWKIFNHKGGRFSDGPVVQVGRWLYTTNETEGDYTLWRWNIDTHVFEPVGPLPEALRDGNGDDFGRVYLSPLGQYIGMYQELDKHIHVNSDMYILDTQKMAYTKVILPKGVRGNAFTWHSSGWGFLFGGITGFDCCRHPLKHFYLVDLQHFGGTGESLE